MNTHDNATRVICTELNLRAYTATTAAAVKGISSIHGTNPIATTALGRTITSAVLMASTLKPESSQSVSVKFSGSGPIGEIHVQADAAGNVRGYISNPDPDVSAETGETCFSKAIGAGFLTVMKDLGLKDPYSSVTPIHYGDIAPDLAYYFAASEQVPSAIIIGLDLDETGGPASSGGILIQTFPETPGDSISIVENNIQSMKKPLGLLLREGSDILGVLSDLFGGKTMNILHSNGIRHSCRCDKALIEAILGSLPSGELESMASEDRGARISCSFCKKDYVFSEDELRGILAGKKP
ncbi:MAG: Hsp33 family molecular chaperone HslO [Spirochaetes bacterium]|jgi:molecular chaperone Hsp33|nr:Hsp33 family molecular chaperone HslO [Spirochaetota bacterium]